MKAIFFVGLNVTMEASAYPLNHAPFPAITWASLCRCFFSISLFVMIIPLFVPLTPKMPAPGIDSSWALGLNQAIAQGLAFGKDIIFTLGPYSSIYTKSYHPATDGMMLWGSFYLACSYWLALILLFKNAPYSLMGAWALFLLALVYAKDSLFLSYPILVGLIIFKNVYADKAALSSRDYLFVILLLLPLGLYPLIKGSLLILCGVLSLLIALLLALYQRYVFALLAVIIPASSLTLFWALAGQSIINIPLYLSNSLRLAFSFTEAMSTRGNTYEVIGYLIVSVFILSLIVKESLPKRLGGFLFALILVFLFLSFKAGFVRHFGHAFIAATSLLLAALLVSFTIRSKLIWLIMLLAFSMSLYIEGQYTQINLASNIASNYSAAWYGLVNRIKEPHWLINNFSLTMNYLKAKNALPIFPGSSDIYSYQQTDLIASGNQWMPRRVPQAHKVMIRDLS